METTTKHKWKFAKNYGRKCKMLATYRNKMFNHSSFLQEQEKKMSRQSSIDGTIRNTVIVLHQLSIQANNRIKVTLTPFQTNKTIRNTPTALIFVAAHSNRKSIMKKKSRALCYLSSLRLHGRINTSNISYRSMFSFIHQSTWSDDSFAWFY